MAFSNQLSRVIKLIGPQAAIRLSRQYGGRTYRVPKSENLHDLHPLVVAIGIVAATKFTAEFEEQAIKFPNEICTLMQVRDDHVIARLKAEESASSIAVDLQIDRKLVQKIAEKYAAMGRFVITDQLQEQLSL